MSVTSSTLLLPISTPFTSGKVYSCTEHRRGRVLGLPRAGRTPVTSFVSRFPVHIQSGQEGRRTLVHCLVDPKTPKRHIEKILVDRLAKPHSTSHLSLAHSILLNPFPSDTNLLSWIFSSFSSSRLFVPVEVDPITVATLRWDLPIPPLFSTDT